MRLAFLRNETVCFIVKIFVFPSRWCGEGPCHSIRISALCTALFPPRDSHLRIVFRSFHFITYRRAVAICTYSALAASLKILTVSGGCIVQS